MTSKNKFGFGPLDTEGTRPRRERAPGPMGAAVRDAAEALSETTEAKVEQRRKNAEDAKAFRAAQEQGRVLVALPLEDVHTDDLPRDRLRLSSVAASDEMDELKTSIRERGQKEPIEVYPGSDGRYQLKKGWRRWTALQQLFSETGDAGFSTVIARIDAGQGDRILRYIDMVEENVVREDLTFAEMAQVAITAAEDSEIEEDDPLEMVGRLYGALHKTKRSYIRTFVYLLTELHDRLNDPKVISRNLGLSVARKMKDPGGVTRLRDALRYSPNPDYQNGVLEKFVAGGFDRAGVATKKTPKGKFEFFVGSTKVTARNGEFRLVCGVDYASVPQPVLERAVRDFERALEQAAGTGSEAVTRG